MSFIKRILGIPEPKIVETEAERTVRKIREKFQISDSLADEILGKKSLVTTPPNGTVRYIQAPLPTSFSSDYIQAQARLTEERIRQREEAERVQSEILRKMEEERRRREEQIRKVKAKLDEDILSIQDCFYELGDMAGANKFSVDSPSLGCYNLRYEILGVGQGMRLTDKVLDMFRTIRPSTLRAKSLFPEYTFSIFFENNRVIIKVAANMDRSLNLPHPLKR